MPPNARTGWNAGSDPEPDGHDDEVTALDGDRAAAPAVSSSTATPGEPDTRITDEPAEPDAHDAGSTDEPAEPARTTRLLACSPLVDELTVPVDAQGSEFVTLYPRGTEVPVGQVDDVIELAGMSNHLVIDITPEPEAQPVQG